MNSVSDPASLSPDPDPAFCILGWITIRIRIQDFYDQKLENKFATENFLATFLLLKIGNFTYT